MQRIVARHLQLLQRVVDQHRVAEGRGLHRLPCRHSAQRRAQALQLGIGFGPAAGLALQEDQLPAGRQVAAAHAQRHRGAHAFGGLGLHAQLLERGAQVEVQVRIVDLQRQRLQEHRHRLGVARQHAAAPWPSTSGRGGRAPRRRAAARRHCKCFVGTAQRQQRMRFQRVAEDLLRVSARACDAARCTASAGTAALDQRMGGGQAVGRIGMQLGGLLEGGGGSPQRSRRAWPCPACHCRKACSLQRAAAPAGRCGRGMAKDMCCATRSSGRHLG